LTQFGDGLAVYDQARLEEDLEEVNLKLVNLGVVDVEVVDGRHWVLRHYSSVS